MRVWTMSSETSTESQSGAGREADALQPWQLFTLAGLIGATLTVFMCGWDAGLRPAPRARADPTRTRMCRQFRASVRLRYSVAPCKTASP